MGEYLLRAAVLDDEMGVFDLMVVRHDGPGLAPKFYGWARDGAETVTGVWVATHGEKLVAYATADPLPGLPDIYELAGAVAPEHRRLGLGTRMLDFVCREAAAQGIPSFSLDMSKADDFVAPWLLERGFVHDHWECVLVRDSLDALPPVPEWPEASLKTFPRRDALPLFCRLYDQAFAGLPWAQPYSVGELESYAELGGYFLFLLSGDEVVGFTLLHPGPEQGMIEPFGVVPAYQGQGYGRKLLIGALHKMRERGMRAASIGTWDANTRALGLYRSLGFRADHQTRFLARDLTRLKAP